MVEAVSRLEVLSPAERDAIAAGPQDRSAHAALLERLSFSRHVELASPQAPDQPASSLRVVAWNLNRGRRPGAAAALLRQAGADLALLSELDFGMARSGQLHSTKEIAAALGAGYAFGVEFLELGLGSAAECEAHTGKHNEVGYHGGAIVSTHPLENPDVVRLEARGDWFGPERGERRVGGRIAVLATLPVAGVEVQFASLHLDSHGEPQERAKELAVLLEAVEARSPGGPALLGGDLNTSSLGSAELADPQHLRSALEADPKRFSLPFRWEPLFETAQKAGYEWRRCNATGGGTHRSLETHQPTALRLDWFLSRGLVCEEPALIPAVDPDDGTALSDHEALAVRIRPA